MLISDANGNITHVTDETCSLVASYDYGPFGGTISSSGAEAVNNKFRFSTKYMDEETGLAYYGYRYYDPEVGRWLSRDPIWEKEAMDAPTNSRWDLNVYGFTRNSPTMLVDTDGRGNGPPFDGTGTGCEGNAAPAIPVVPSPPDCDEASEVKNVKPDPDASGYPRRCGPASAGAKMQ